MDITVSRLNERMALRVPPELPLGLVFIVGRVEAIRPYAPDPGEVALRLTDGKHSLPCRLPQQVAEEMQLAGDERVRAGGHLLFDTHEACYYLLARDIEVLPSLGGEDEGTRRLPRAAAQEQSGSEALAPGELPPWVQQLAPPEVHPELGLPAAPAAQTMEIETLDEAPPLPPELVDYLSQAIDSDQEIELTPSLVHELLEQHTTAPVGMGAVELRAYDSYEPAGTSVLAGSPEPEAPEYLAAATITDDDSVPAPELPEAPVATAEQHVSPATGTQRRQTPAPQRQTLLLLAGVFALFVLILVLFVVIALAAGYTPFLLP